VQLLRTTRRMLLEVTPAGVRAVLERLRGLLHEGTLHPRIEQQVQHLFELRKHQFKKIPPRKQTQKQQTWKEQQQQDHDEDEDDDDLPILPAELDLVEEEDQITHEISLDDDDLFMEEQLDTFNYVTNQTTYEQEEKEWYEMKCEILGLKQKNNNDDDDSESDDDDSDDGDSETDDDEEDEDDQDNNNLGGAIETSHRSYPQTRRRTTTIQIHRPRLLLLYKI